ncbi:MAG: hypothetical protein KAW12_14755, partial [Candidatus Aminicenantes bacterium]|nr:hypothetical protein [Candidatus Aminicenantes bacterium]
PAFFVFLDNIPLNANGKVDRGALPAPDAADAVEEFIPPGNELEKKLAEIWSGVLDIEPGVIGIDTNFFELGGHSLKATLLISRIHKELNVKIKLTDIFTNPTIRGLSTYLDSAAVDKFSAIVPVEKREYYLLSSAQERLYLLHRMAPLETAYNLPASISIEGELDKKKLAGTFRQLIDRHESFRTSFVMVADNPVQRVHSPEEIEFEIEGASPPADKPLRRPTTWAGYKPLRSSRQIEAGDKGRVIPHHSSFITHNSALEFIRPFDLTCAPLLRVGLIELEEARHILMLDMHHIAADGTSMGVLLRDFMDIYAGEELPQLGIQYKDFSNWQNSPGVKEALLNQEAYWLERFSGEAPVLDLPTDFPRPVQQSFAGAALRFELSAARTSALN